MGCAETQEGKGSSFQESHFECGGKTAARSWSGGQEIRSGVN